MNDDTPRTKIELVYGHCTDISEEYVYANFARELEIENQKLRNTLVRIKSWLKLEGYKTTSAGITEIEAALREDEPRQ